MFGGRMVDMGVDKNLSIWGDWLITSMRQGTDLHINEDFWK